MPKTHVSSRIHPQKFALWTAMASILMMFAALTSAYIVRKAQGNWVELSLPNIFYYSTIILLVSSITLHTSYRSFISGNEKLYKGLLVVSFVLGLSFVVMQYEGWMHLFNMGIDMKGNPSGAFVYVMTGVHALHVLGGIAAILVAMLHAFRLKYRVTPKRKVRFELVVHYWHFVDILWVYLFVFLLFS